MSFSSDVKKELSRVSCEDMYDCAAEFAALLIFGGEVIKKDGGVPDVIFHNENPLILEHFISLTSQMGAIAKKIESYSYGIPKEDQRMRLLKYSGFMDDLGRIAEEEDFFGNSLLQKNTCQRAFLRGAFLASGSITDPEKNYHFEITCNSETLAVLLREQMEFFGLEAKIVLRKKYFVVYMKEGAMISDILAVMGGSISKLNFESVRVLKDVRNVVNRRVNCETANINKTVSASRKQIEDIEYVISMVGMQGLPVALREIACARLEEPSATLKELGEALDPPVGKSGVNHRLRKLSQMAQDLRDKKGR